MLLTSTILTAIAAVLAWKLLDGLENRDYWTLTLRLSLVYEIFLVPFYLLLLWSTLQVCWNLQSGILRYQILWQVVISLLAFGISTFYIWQLGTTRVYRRLRWQAWSGPSRTGIPHNLAYYIGDREDWVALESSLEPQKSHPVERFAKFASPLTVGIASDPTDLLRARAALDAESDCLWVPRTDDKPCVYYPIGSDQSISLLWGDRSGFRARCSRGIVAVPRALLTTWPRLEQGVDGRPICLAYAILARNKGLEPASLVCNLEEKRSFRMFEENSIFWPRPSKTLRGLYRQEFARTFSLLGDSYVAAATELALLLADVPAWLIKDWLGEWMEHQDLLLNRKAAEHGASLEDLARLYRGHYAAMLVSLSLHQRGLRLRPELLVFEALCDFEGVERSAWTCEPWAIERREEEFERCGSGVSALVQAIV